MKPSQTQQLMEMLKQGVRQVCEQKEYKNYLRVMARFPSYSPKNCMLIYAQCPHATFVAGFQTWKKQFGRHVKKGEKAIRILAPCTFKSSKENENGESTDQVFLGFRTVSVFDYSQTEGEPLPLLAPLPVLEGDVENFENLWKALCSCTDFQIALHPAWGEARGRCHYEDREIHIRKGMPQRQSLKTLIHELAHSLLHDPRIQNSDPFFKEVLENRQIREIEAESVAFVVCLHFGLDCSEYSFDYIARWKEKEDILEQSLNRISALACQIIQQTESFLSPDGAVFLFLIP